MNTTYGILFSVQLFHEYYKSQKCNDFEIIPSDETKQRLDGQKIIYRNLGNELVTGIEVDGNSPRITLGDDLILRFYLRSLNPYFGNLTCLNLENQKGKIYYYSNLANNKVNDILYLTQPVSIYSNSNSYTAGDFTSDSSGNTFEAIKNSSSADPHGHSETNYWKNTGQNQYTSSNDLILKSNAQFEFVLTSPSNTADIKISSFNPSSNNYDFEIYSETKSFSSVQSSILVNLSQLKNGKYKISINGKEQFVYFDKNLTSGNVFGVFEIFYNDLVNADYKLLDSSGNLRELLYTIKFRNRSTYWKYIARTTDVTSVFDSSGAHEFESAGEPLKFISKKPIPLSEEKIKTFQLDVTGIGTVNSIRNPSVNLINQIEQSGNTYYCSEAYINY